VTGRRYAADSCGSSTGPNFRMRQNPVAGKTSTVTIPAATSAAALTGRIRPSAVAIR
jgi:hypothetical protein